MRDGAHVQQDGGPGPSGRDDSRRLRLPEGLGLPSDNNGSLGNGHVAVAVRA